MTWPLVEFLLLAADLARQGYSRPLSALVDGRTGAEADALARLVIEACAQAMAVTPHVFEYRGNLLADTLLEAAYRVAEGRGC